MRNLRLRLPKPKPVPKPEPVALPIQTDKKSEMDSVFIRNGDGWLVQIVDKIPADGVEWEVKRASGGTSKVKLTALRYTFQNKAGKTVRQYKFHNVR